MKFLIMATAAATLALAPTAFAAGNGHGAGGNGNGNGNSGRSDDAVRAQSNQGVGSARGWTTNNGVVVNPGGHVMSRGLPPGQAKKLNRQAGGLVVGNVLASNYPGYQVIGRNSAYNLPAAPAGYEYVRVGNNAYLRQTNTGVISSVVQNLFR